LPQKYHQSSTFREHPQTPVGTHGPCVLRPAYTFIKTHTQRSHAYTTASTCEHCGTRPHITSCAIRCTCFPSSRLARSCSVQRSRAFASRPSFLTVLRAYARSPTHSSVVAEVALWGQTHRSKCRSETVTLRASKKIKKKFTTTFHANDLTDNLLTPKT
jgi:hypothetical protein